MNNYFDVSSHTICITGSSRGLGFSLADHFGARGARVVISSNDSDELSQAHYTLSERGYQVSSAVADVWRSTDCDGLVAHAREVWGSLDVMICNAGTDIIKGGADYSDDEWDHIVGTNLRGYYLAARAAVREMLERGTGSIIMTSSVSGSCGIPGLVPYAASKGGVDAMVRTMAVEWADQRVRVNAVAPGFINNFMDGVHPDLDTPYQRRALAFTPMGRRGELEEYAGPYQFLASKASSFVTGTTLYVDGGYWAT